MTDKKVKKQHKRVNRIEVRLNDIELAKLRQYADRNQQPMTEAIRDWVKQLPEVALSME